MLVHMVQEIIVRRLAIMRKKIEKRKSVGGRCRNAKTAVAMLNPNGTMLIVGETHNEDVSRYQTSSPVMHSARLLVRVRVGDIQG